MQESNEREFFVSGALSTSFRFCQMFGGAPIQMKPAQDGFIVSFSRKLYIAQCIFVTIIATSTIITGIYIKFQDNFMWPCIWNIVMIGSVVGVYRAPTRLRAVMEVLSRIQKVNNSLGFQKKRATESKKSTAIVLFTTYFMCLAIVNPRTVPAGNIWTTFFYVLHAYQYTVTVTENIKFALCAHEVAQTLRSINELLEYISRTSLQGLEAAYKTNRSFKTLEQTFQQLARSYSEVCKMVRVLNVGSEIMLMLMIIGASLSLIYAPNRFIIHYIRSYPPVWNAVWLIQWSLMQLFLLLIIIQPCHEIQQESEKTNFTTSKLMAMCEDELCLAQLEKLSKNFLLTNVSIIPCGICTLSQTLFSSIIVRVTTYLIIVIQLNDLE